MIIAITVTVVSIVLYLVVGSLIDWRHARRNSQRDEALQALTESTFLDHDSAQVRATAIDSSTRIDADWLLPKVAHALTDRSWKVRRAAGEALSKSGALGDLYLRAALDSPDPFAADMARNFLEMTGRMEQLQHHHHHEQVDSLTAWAQR